MHLRHGLIPGRGASSRHHKASICGNTVVHGLLERPSRPTELELKRADIALPGGSHQIYASSPPRNLKRGTTRGSKPSDLDEPSQHARYHPSLAWKRLPSFSDEKRLPHRGRQRVVPSTRHSLSHSMLSEARISAPDRRWWSTSHATSAKNPTTTPEPPTASPPMRSKPEVASSELSKKSPPKPSRKADAAKTRTGPSRKSQRKSLGRWEAIVNVRWKSLVRLESLPGSTVARRGNAAGPEPIRFAISPCIANNSRVARSASPISASSTRVDHSFCISPRKVPAFQREAKPAMARAAKTSA